MPQMYIDVNLESDSPSDVISLSKSAEDFGFDCIWVSETKRDPFIYLSLIANNTSNITLGTSIALAFTRSPMDLAYSAWDLQKLSKGRFILGLGSQVKGHIERRYSMTWSEPILRMREVINSIRSIWSCWQNGDKLDFNGKLFSFNLMPPFFNPGPISHPNIPIFLAAVNTNMCKLAGELADGILVHPLHTSKYLEDIMVPSIMAGANIAGRSRSDFQIDIPVFAAIGTPDEIELEKQLIRYQIAFYSSTRTYSAIFKLHGWDDVVTKLHEKSLKGDWGNMPDLISDDILSHFIIEGSWDDLPTLLRKRYSHIADRVHVSLPFNSQNVWKNTIINFKNQ